MRLTPDARTHLFRLAGLHPALTSAAGRDLVHPSPLHLLDAIPAAAAYVLSPAFDVLAKNAIATALLAPFEGTSNASAAAVTSLAVPAERGATIA